MSDSSGAQDPVAIGGDGVLHMSGAMGPSMNGATMRSMSIPARVAAFAVVLFLGLAACQPATESSSPSRIVAGPTANSSNAPTSAGSSPSPETASPPLAGQTDTAWGRIWDSLPAGFPAYPGATPAQEAAGGPASAVLVVQGAEPRTIADWMRSSLERATYSTEALNGPFEDGSYVLESIGMTAGCRVRVSMAPLGGLTTVTVLYGGSCPKP